MKHLRYFRINETLEEDMQFYIFPEFIEDYGYKLEIIDGYMKKKELQITSGTIQHYFNKHVDISSKMTDLFKNKVIVMRYHHPHIGKEYSDILSDFRSFKKRANILGYNYKSKIFLITTYYTGGCWTLTEFVIIIYLE